MRTEVRKRFLWYRGLGEKQGFDLRYVDVIVVRNLSTFIVYKRETNFVKSNFSKQVAQRVVFVASVPM